GGEDDEMPRRGVARHAERVFPPARHEDAGAGPAREGLAFQPVGHLAGEDHESLVLGVVDMARRPRAGGGEAVHDGHGAAGLGRGQELAVERAVPVDRAGTEGGGGGVEHRSTPCHATDAARMAALYSFDQLINYRFNIHMTNISTFDLNLLRVLDALLRESSVTRAATRVGLSQPATSAALGRLRHALGDPLFVRHGQRLVPTDHALSLEVPLREILDRTKD